MPNVKRRRNPLANIDEGGVHVAGLGAADVDVEALNDFAGECYPMEVQHETPGVSVTNI